MTPARAPAGSEGGEDAVLVAVGWLPADGSWRRQDMHAPVPALNALRSIHRGCESAYDGKSALWRRTPLSKDAAHG